MVFRILPRVFGAKARPEGPSGKRALLAMRTGWGHLTNPSESAQVDGRAYGWMDFIPGGKTKF